jgi:hypothetical protein
MDGEATTSTEVTPSIESDVTPQIEPQVQEETGTEAKETDGEGTGDESQTQTDAEKQAEETFLGTYKSKEDAEKGLKEKDDFIAQTRQELADLKKSLEPKKDSIVTQEGQIDPNIIRSHAINLTMQEIGLYRENMYNLDSESQAEVNKLLNDYQSTGNKKAFDEAKSYFNAPFVEQVSSWKTQEAIGIESKLLKEQSKFTDEQKTKYFGNLPETVSKFTNKDSELYSPLIERYLNENYNRVTAEELAPQFAELEQKIINNYLKTKTAQAQAQKDTAKLKSPTGGNAPVGDKIFTDEEIKNMSDTEYEKNRALILKQAATVTNNK